MNLDSLAELKKFDTHNVYSSIALLPDQLEQAWQEVKESTIPANCSLAAHIVIAGMGGSALGGRIIKSLTASAGRAPIEVVTDYHLPQYVGADTLIILSSYSGNTEETLAVAEEALERKAQIFVITTGGALADFAKNNSLPSYIFDPHNNPAGAPRLALGYSVGAIAALLSRCHFISLTDEAIQEAIVTARKCIQEFGVENPESQNIAKKIARELKGKLPVLVASEHLWGATIGFRNQLNESAKTFAVSFDLPELNHHLIEGLKNPGNVKPLLYFLFIYSDKYTKRLAIRYEVTKKIIIENGIQNGTYTLESASKLEQVFELLVFGSFTHYYLSILYELDPSPIPWIDFLKKELANS